MNTSSIAIATASTSTNSLPWQDEKRLSSGERIWILTDTYTEWTSFYPNSPSQQWFRVGAFDLTTGKLGYVRFSIDDANSMVRAGLPPPPWGAPLPYGIEVKRMAHSGQEKGRFKVEITLFDIDGAVAWVGPAGRELFRRAGHTPNSSWGMWKKLVDRAALEKAIETAAMGMTERFSASDVKRVVGKDVNVSPVLGRLVEEGRLLPFGKKRGAKYEVVLPTMPVRVDWTG